MAVQLVEPTRPARQLRRVVRGEIRSARAALRGAPADVHTARRALKRARGLVRLGREAWQPEHRRRLGLHLRDAGRRASPTRDAEACVEAMNRIIAQPDLPCLDDAELVRNRLVRLRDRSLASVDSLAGVQEALRLLRTARRTLKRHPPHGRGRGLAVFAPGLLRLHRRGSEALAEARRHPDDPNTHHELRKRAKNLRYALEFLEPVWAAVLDIWVSELHRLTDQLGEGNDLTVLLAVFDARPTLLAGLDAARLIAMIREVRSARWEAGLELAVRIWTPTSEDFVRDILDWGEAWKNEACRASVAPPTPQVPQNVT